MKNLMKEKYVKHDVSEEWLRSNGFRHNPIFSDEESEAYTCRFPVYKYGDFNVLDCELTVMLKTGEVRINVYDCNTRSKYAAFYNRQYGDYSSMLNEINEKIGGELRKLGIGKGKNEKDGSKNKKAKKRGKNTGKRKERSGRI